jgi:DNA-binding NarL/FixJ family response regulator
MERSTAGGTETPAVVIWDRFHFRGAGTASLLEGWAKRYGLTVHTAKCLSVPDDPSLPLNWRMLILSIGRLTVKDPTPQKWARCVRAGGPIVIISERDELEEALAAFQLGACGFIPMSSDPSLALHAFTFILSGGSVFPPALLYSLRHLNFRRRLATSLRTHTER